MEELGQGSGAWKRSSRSKWSQWQGCGRGRLLQRGRRGSGRAAVDTAEQQSGSAGTAVGAATEGCVGRNIYGATVSQTVLN